MKFIGRKSELDRLTKLYSKDEFGAALIYGRRRIGKSELIKESIKKSKMKSLYYVCSETQERTNVDALSSIVSKTFNLPKMSFSNAVELLEFIFEKSNTESFVFVLDEYPYLRNKVEGLDSILQSLIDRYKDTSKMKFILCGSFVEVMKSLLEKNNPLYGRFNASLNLKQMDYYESSLFYPSFSNEDKVKLYSVFGGIPYYNREIDPNMTVEENIINLIAAPSARFIDEVDNYLKTEISKIENANEVLDALSRGFSRFKDIQDQSYVSSGPTLIDILKKLINMDVVVKEASINDENNTKKAGYYISDNMSRFYFRYINRYRSYMNVLDSKFFFKEFIKEDFESQFVPKRFEEICKQYLIEMNKAGKINPPFFKIGKYYYNLPKEHKNGEFDVVTEDKNGYIFYEAKFTSKPVNKTQIDEEITQIESTGLNAYRYGFISKNGFTKIDNKEYILITLDDLYY